MNFKQNNNQKSDKMLDFTFIWPQIEVMQEYSGGQTDGTKDVHEMEKWVNLSLQPRCKVCPHVSDFIMRKFTCK